MQEVDICQNLAEKAQSCIMTLSKAKEMESERVSKSKTCQVL